jgi:hypothetical protein
LLLHSETAVLACLSEDEDEDEDGAKVQIIDIPTGRTRALTGKLCSLLSWAPLIV